MRDRCLALAAAFQSADLVTQIARTGKYETKATADCLGSVYSVDTQDVDVIFGGPQGVTLGLATLQEQLGGKQRDAELLRYLIAMSALQQKLRSYPEVVSDLRRQIKGCDHQAWIDVDHPNRVARLAQIYEETLSTIKPRILVRGRTDFLQQQNNINLIRALLLAGVRACAAWHQAGGRRWHLIVKRNEILSAARQLS